MCGSSYVCFISAGLRTTKWKRTGMSEWRVCVCVWLLVISLKLTQHNASAVTVERVRVNYGLLLNIFQYQIINRQRYVPRIVSLKMKIEITKKSPNIYKYEIFYYLGVGRGNAFILEGREG